MATPGEYIPALHDYAGNLIAKEVRSHVPTNKRILDIGAGWGKYRFLLPEYEMDAVDIFQPYVEENKLDAYYRNVYVQDASDFNYTHRYGAVIMGDVLEHLDIEAAQRMVRNACMNADYVFIATPFQMKQEAVGGNDHEAHIQDDLGEGPMAERYPELELFDLFSRENEHTKAIYIKKGQNSV